jgi:hypothetical protein
MVMWKFTYPQLTVDPKKELSSRVTPIGNIGIFGTSYVHDQKNQLKPPIFHATETNCNLSGTTVGDIENMENIVDDLKDRINYLERIAMYYRCKKNSIEKNESRGSN